MRKAILKLQDKEWIAAVILASCFLFLLKFSWLKWGDLIIDSGREMYVPSQVLAGRLLYRDIFYQYGPFAPYFNALFFKILGVHLRALILSGAIAATGTAILVYKLSKIYLGSLFSTFSALTFIFVFAFGQYVPLGNYNFILPFSYAAAYGVLFGLSALYFFYKSAFRHARQAPYFLSASLTLLCRIEMGLAVLAALTPAAIIFGLSEKQKCRAIVSGLLRYIILPGLFALSVYGFFFAQAGDAIVGSNLPDIFLANLNTKNQFTGFVAGTANLAENSRLALQVFFHYFLLCALFAAGGWIVSRPARVGRLSRKPFLALPAAIIFTSLAVFFFRNSFNFRLQYRCLPLICLAALLLSLWKLKAGKDRAEYIFMIAFSTYALLSLGRMFFNAWAGHYGFYMLVPGMILYGIFFLRMVPAFIQSPLARNYFCAGLLLVFALSIKNHFDVSRSYYRSKTLKVSSPRGSLYVYDSESNYRCRELIEYLSRETKTNETVAVMPEGLAINFLSGRANPLYHYSYLPMELQNSRTEDNIISDMIRKQPDFMVLIQRDASEFGYAAFGLDYGTKVWRYVADNYSLSRQFGPLPFASGHFGAALFKRNQTDG